MRWPKPLSSWALSRSMPIGLATPGGAHGPRRPAPAAGALDGGGRAGRRATRTRWRSGTRSGCGRWASRGTTRTGSSRDRDPAQGSERPGPQAGPAPAELGVVLDLAHASEQTWRDVLDEAVPFSVTHGCCRALRDHPAQPRRLAAGGARGARGRLRGHGDRDLRRPGRADAVPHARPPRPRGRRDGESSTSASGPTSSRRPPPPRPAWPTARRARRLSGVRRGARQRGYDGGDRLEAIEGGNRPGSLYFPLIFN